MSWVSVGVTAGSAMLGARRAERKQQAQHADNLAAAEQTRYSPWSGMQGGQIHLGGPSTLDGALGGGVQGLGIAQALQQSKLFGPDTPKTTSESMSALDPNNPEIQKQVNPQQNLQNFGLPTLFSQS